MLECRLWPPVGERSCPSRGRRGSLQLHHQALGLNRSPTWFPMWRELIPLLPDSNPGALARAVNHTYSPSLALVHWLRGSHVTQAGPRPPQGFPGGF